MEQYISQLWLFRLAPIAGAASSPLSIRSSPAEKTKPEILQLNILVIWGDDIGLWNVSDYNQGAMGYKTRNRSVKIPIRTSRPPPS